MGGADIAPDFLEDLLACWDFLHLMGVAETEVTTRHAADDDTDHIILLLMCVFVSVRNGGGCMCVGYPPPIPSPGADFLLVSSCVAHYREVPCGEVSIIAV